MSIYRGQPPVLQNVKNVVSLFSVTVTSEQLKTKAMKQKQGSQD